MKKLIFVVLGTTAFLVTAYRAGISTESENLSDIQLANVEALVQNESTDRTCYSTITSKEGCQVRYCPTCTFISGTDTWYAPRHSC